MPRSPPGRCMALSEVLQGKGSPGFLQTLCAEKVGAGGAVEKGIKCSDL